MHLMVITSTYYKKYFYVALPAAVYLRSSKKAARKCNRLVLRSEVAGLKKSTWELDVGRVIPSDRQSAAARASGATVSGLQKRV